MTGTELLAGLTLAGIKVDELANFSQVDPSTIKDMVARGSQAVRAEGGTVRKVIDALKVKGGVEITQDGVRLAKKPRARRYWSAQTQPPRKLARRANSGHDNLKVPAGHFHERARSKRNACVALCKSRSPAPAVQYFFSHSSRLNSLGTST
jgi:hypothetical protein